MINLSRTVFLSMCFAGTPHAMAQSIAIPDEAVWHEETWLYDWLTLHHATFTFSADGDTLIDGLLYTKIHQYGVDSISTLGSSDPAVAGTLDRYVGAIRVDGIERRWFVYFDGYPNELLLYDFDLAVGSNTLGIWGDCGIGLTVNEIDSVLVGAEWRSRSHLDLPGRFIIEGIGSSAGLFGQLCQAFKEYGCLHVYEQPGAQVSVDGCSTLSTSIGPVSMDDDRVVAYPNPTAGVVYLDGAPANVMVLLLDGTGRPVMRTWRAGAGDPVDLSPLESGIYTLRVGSWSVRVMKE